MISSGDLVTTAARALVHKYVPLARDEKLKAEVDHLLMACWPSIDQTATPGLREAPGLLVVGDSGAGKSTAIQRVFSQHSLLPNYGVEGGLCPVISINAPAPATLLQLGRTLLRALGYPLVADPKRHVVWEMVSDRLRHLGVVAIHVDEIHNVTRTANVNERDQILATLKSLMNDRAWPVGLLLSGLPEVVEFINTDAQVARRMRAISFDQLSTPLDTPFIEKLVTKFADKVSCARPDGFGAAIAPRLVHAGGGTLGIVVEILIEAIGLALKRSKPLNITHFADAYALRTACLRSVNPFYAEAWEGIQVTRLLAATPRAEAKPLNRRRSRGTGGAA